MSTSSTSLTLSTAKDQSFVGGLAEFISIGCFCTLLVSMAVTIAKNPKIKQIQRWSWLKYVYFFAVITNLMVFYEVKRHICPFTGKYCRMFNDNNNHSQYKSSTQSKSSHHSKIHNQYLSNSSFAMYSLLDWTSKMKPSINDDADQCDVTHHKFNSIEYNINPMVNAEETTKSTEEQPQITQIPKIRSNIQKYNHFRTGQKQEIKPKYSHLKEELLNNNVYKLSEEQYDELYEESMDLYKIYGDKMKAKSVQKGKLNEEYGISAGSPITIPHLMVLKLYTDWDQFQRKFKLNHGSPETAHFFGLLKEAVLFYGRKMRKHERLYCGLKQKTVFDAMTNMIEIPLSTTTEMSVASNFAGDNGIVLVFERGNGFTRYLNVSGISAYPHEQERLIMGSMLKIYDIFVNGRSMRKYVAAIHLLERLYKGKAKRVNEKTQRVLYEMMEEIEIAEREGVGDWSYVMVLFVTVIIGLKRKDEEEGMNGLDEIGDKRLRDFLKRIPGHLSNE